jgi:hypothetical protein
LTSPRQPSTRHGLAGFFQENFRQYEGKVARDVKQPGPRA